MPSSERRTTRRLNFHLPLNFRRPNAISEGENGAVSINVSAGGVSFHTTLALLVGERIEVAIKMPRQITGAMPCKHLFTGRVTHVESQTALPACLRVGVHLLYYEAESGRKHSRDVGELGRSASAIGQ